MKNTISEIKNTIFDKILGGINMFEDGKENIRKLEEKSTKITKLKRKNFFLNEQSLNL